MKIMGLLLAIFVFVYGSKGQSIPPIGQWREHVPFSSATHLEEIDGNIYCATAFGYFIYNPLKNEFQRKTKVNGLSDVALKLFRKDFSKERICIVYKNSNIDLIDGENIKNIPDVLLKKTQSDKTINDIYWYKNELFLSSNLGIIVINPDKKEIKETYKTGLNNLDEKVFQVAVKGDSIYAATSNGLKKAFILSNALGNNLSWTLESDDVLGSSECNAIINWQGNLVAQKHDSIFLQKDTHWELLYNSPTPILGIICKEEKLFVFQTENEKGNILIFSTPSLLPQKISSASISAPVDCKIIGDVLWVADRNNGLLKISGVTEKIIKPDAPDGIATGDGFYLNGKLLVAAGSVDQDWYPLNNANGFFSFDGNEWKNFNRLSNPIFDTIKDIITVIEDPGSSKIYAGSFGDGLAEISGSNVKIFKQHSPISSSVLFPDSYRVGGIAIDKDQNIWISNYGAIQNLLVKKKDDTWRKFTIPFTHKENAVGKIIVDNANMKWIISPKGNGLFCFDDAGTVDQENDDRWRYFGEGKGNGNLPSSNVLSIVCDRYGFVWVGTDKGVAIIECGSNIFNGIDCDATLPIVQQDNYAGLLFGDESINDIAVDGANRKWIATKNGVWLVSADGQKIIYRFTEVNSPLLHNLVHRIVINQTNGEIFFFTQNGICSFVSTATEPATEKRKTIVFPNPVPPGFNGTIAIRGLPENAWVKITELDGRLVHQTRSLGGQAIWNGRNYKGEKVSSGVYLVLVSDEFNTQQLATKIFFIK